MSQEVVVARRWALVTLRADATLAALVSTRIYRTGTVPDGATYPLALVHDSAIGADMQTFGPSVNTSQVVLLVRAVDNRTTTDRIEAVADRIDELLQNKAGSATGGVIVRCLRERPYTLTEGNTDNPYEYLGYYYRVWVTLT